MCEPEYALVTWIVPDEERVGFIIAGAMMSDQKYVLSAEAITWGKIFQAILQRILDFVEESKRRCLSVHSTDAELKYTKDILRNLIVTAQAMPADVQRCIHEAIKFFKYV